MNIIEARREINEAIEGLNWNKQPETLYTPIEYLLSIGGKRMRPLLSLMGCYLFSGSYKEAIKPSLAIEVFHNFTLMHDDIMDNAPLRRGKKTVHEKWNNNVAILSGDAMLIEAYQLLMHVPTEALPKLMPLFNRCALEVCEGQQFDMEFEERALVNKSEYLNMIRLKTAVLLGFSLQMGAILGGAPKEQAQLLYDFGVKIGIGFQLKDDLLDVYGDKNKFGKQVGGDILANKKTYLLLHALEVSQGEKQQELQSWIDQQKPNPEEKVKAVTKIYDDLGVRKFTEEVMNGYFEEGLSLLNSLKVNQARKSVIKQFIEELIQREQ